MLTIWAISSSVCWGWAVIALFPHAPSPPTAPAAPLQSSTGQQQSSNRNNSGGGNKSDAEIALEQFHKKITSADITLSKLETNAAFTKWAVEFRGYLKLNDLYLLVGDPAETGYVVPSDLTSAEGQLHIKRNTWLYLLLLKYVTSSDGKAIIKTHRNDYDGISAWKELEALHLTDVSAQHRASHFKSRLASMRADERPKVYLDTINEFQDVRDEHDAYVPQGREIDDEDFLTYLESYLSPIKEFKDLKIKMDMDDDADRTKGQPVRTAKERVKYYKRYAIVLDRDRKDQALTMRNRAEKSYRAAAMGANMTEIDLYDQAGTYDVVIMD